nr:cytochrome b6/f complex subunit IV [Helleborus thibetanus]
MMWHDPDYIFYLFYLQLLRRTRMAKRSFIYFSSSNSRYYCM